MLPSVAVMNFSSATPFRRLILPALTVLMLLSTATPAAAGAGIPRTLMEGGFSEPLFVTNAGDSRLFVVEKGGLIKIIGGGTFLDLSAKVDTDGERGLLALAFHPNYASNGLFYVMYTRASDGDVMITEFHRSGDPDVADAGSERVVLRVEHSSATNHNGGTLMFKNDLMYITLGDGATVSGVCRRSCPSSSGKILRINPLDPDGNGGLTYSIPPGNPYVGRSGLDEIWSYGLRNPWRCSFDRVTWKLWCGDVGQGAHEEIDRHRSGKGINFGWPLLEGSHYYNFAGHSQGDPCTANCRYLPIVDYEHSVAGDDNHNVDRRLCVATDRIADLRHVLLRRLRVRTNLGHPVQLAHGNGGARRAGRHEHVHQLLW